MNVAVRFKIMRIEDFLAWEARQELKYEFDGFEPVLMPGGSLNHARIQTNLAIAIGTRLRGSRCEFLGSDMKLLTAMRSRYPDGQVACGPAEGSATFTTTPTLVFEVVSPSSEVTDHVEKLADYETINSIQQYVVLEQDRVAATVHRRGPDGWQTSMLTTGSILDMPSIGIQVPLDELYFGVVFPAA